MAIECPVCGSDQVTLSDHTRSISVPYGPSVKYVARIGTCGVCETSGDFLRVNDARIEEALLESVRREVLGILDYLSGLGMTNAHVERVLGLPTRTIARWKRGEFSESAVVLLRILRTYPWIMRVVDDGFDA